MSTPSRRHFLKTSLAAGAATSLAGLSAPAAHAAAATGDREYYELRSYRLKPGASASLLDGYLEKAFIPALNARGSRNVGVFTEVDVDKKAVTATPKVDSPVWVLITHPNLESVVSVNTELNLDPTVQKAGAAYLETPKATPAFDRVDSWLLRAFTGMPKMEVPAFATEKVPTRIYELRDYDSHSELKALSKIAMFNEGEMSVMRELGMSPLFFGQAIAGPNLPHLRYITGAADLATHLNNWKKFGTHPTWVKMKDMPQYADNTSRTGPSRFVVPKSYSQV